MVDNNIISLDIEFEQPSQEIIQVGCVVGNLLSGEILTEYCEHVNIGKPISEYIQKLTGIRQVDIDNGKTIHQIYEDLTNLHKEYNCFRNCLSWGGGDSDSLRKAVYADDEKFLFGRRWIDVKTVFISYMWSQGESPRSGLAKSLVRIGMNFQGTKHNARDDARNTFLIYRKLLQLMNGEDSIIFPECRGSHDGKHKPQQQMGSITGYICKCCRIEIEPDIS